MRTNFPGQELQQRDGNKKVLSSYKTLEFWNITFDLEEFIYIALTACVTVLPHTLRPVSQSAILYCDMRVVPTCSACTASVSS